MIQGAHGTGAGTANRGLGARLAASVAGMVFLSLGCASSPPPAASPPAASTANAKPAPAPSAKDEETVKARYLEDCRYRRVWGTVLYEGADEVATESDETRAKALFYKGLEREGAKQWEAAEEAYRRAWETTKTFLYAAYLGRAEFMNQKEVLAAEHLCFALRDWPASEDDFIVDDYMWRTRGKGTEYDIPKRQVEDMFVEVRKKVGAVSVLVSEPGARVLIDDKLIGESSTVGEVYIEPGLRIVEAKRFGYRTAADTVQVMQGGTHNLVLMLEPDERVLPVIVGGAVSLALLGTAIGFTIATNDKSADGDAELLAIEQQGQPCPGAPGTSLSAKCGHLSETLTARDRVYVVAVSAYIGAGALAAATAIYAFWPRSAPSSKAALQALPMITSSNLGLVVTGSF